jgi:DNA-binding FadR family transcriptional regulator
MVVKRLSISSSANQTADALAETILAHEGDEDEWLLGSESQLLEQMGIGRPTLRQAARLLEQQQLLVVRRGIRGGFYGQRPTAEGVTSAARVFLRSQGTTFGDVARVELILGIECARLAAQNPDAAAREALTHHYDEVAETPSLQVFRELSTEFQRRVALLSRSPVQYLFVSVLMDLAGQSGGVADAYISPERRSETVSHHLAVAKAISAGEAELAASLMETHLRSMIDLSGQQALSATLEPRSPLAARLEPSARQRAF